MKEKIINYIKKEISTEPLEEIDSAENLLDGGIIDSMGMIRLISFLQEEFQIEVSSEEMTVENFMTVQNIIDYVSKK